MSELLTINDILGIVQENNKDKTVKVKIKRLNKEIELKTMNYKELTEALEGSLTDEMVIYNCCKKPNLKDTKLNGMAFEPHEIVSKIFKPIEITEIAKALLNESGFYGKDVIELVTSDIKNS